MDKLWGQIRGALGDAFGGIQGNVTFGSDRPTTGSLSLGENRVMSGWALFGVFLIGLAVGWAIKSGR